MTSITELRSKMSPKEIVALTILGEARGEGIAGQVAVACVIRNRFHHSPGKYNTMADVCLENRQFSCWNDSDPNKLFLFGVADRMLLGKANDPLIMQSLWIAEGVMNWFVIDNTRSALNYMTAKLFNSKRPTWARNPQNVTQIDSQIFFTAT